MKDVKNVCCNSVCVFSLHQFTHSMNVESEGTNTKECGSCSLGCRNRRKEGKKFARIEKNHDIEQNTIYQHEN